MLKPLSAREIQSLTINNNQFVKDTHIDKSTFLATTYVVFAVALFTALDKKIIFKHYMVHYYNTHHSNLMALSVLSATILVTSILLIAILYYLFSLLYRIYLSVTNRISISGAERYSEQTIGDIKKKLVGANEKDQIYLERILLAAYAELKAKNVLNLNEETVSLGYRQKHISSFVPNGDLESVFGTIKQQFILDQIIDNNSINKIKVYIK
ncbi:hypothetical protein [Acinetobacter sp. P1(2025)]|uniref:hypothetical protein n=1 Tax=Acinetobacter sp. P1(2025) TaxID=3446120 RepID=UPI003F532D56